MALRQAAIATARFGLGARPGEIETAAANPKRWLLEQLEGPYVEPREFAGFLTTAQHRENYYYRYQVLGPDLRRFQDSAQAGGQTALFEKYGKDVARMLGGYVTWVAESFTLEYGARTNVALTTNKPFRERLLRFWSNHLVVPAIKQPSSVVAGAYEREAIRPHVTGKFSDMLLASAKNPGMLVFLDNNISVGPNSKHGKASGKGLNENLAREILELHTMGVEGGYTQADVIALAKGITGWSTWPDTAMTREAVAARTGAGQNGFVFHPDWHEPGAFTVVGKPYPAGGVQQGEAMLYDLARKPATARFLAGKLARHFVSDEPSRELVDRLAKAYLASETSLAEMARALVESPEAWEQAQSKLKQPEDYVISCYRALNLKLGGGAPVPPVGVYNFESYDNVKNGWARRANDPNETGDLTEYTDTRAKIGIEIAHFYRDIRSMGQAPWRASGPQGWYDRWADWSGADSMLKRVEWSLALAASHTTKSNANVFLKQSLADLASPDLVTLVSRAATNEHGVALTLASPDFQRR